MAINTVTLKSTFLYKKYARVQINAIKTGVQSNLYITALYIAYTLCTTVTEQLPKNHLLYLLLS